MANGWYGCTFFIPRIPLIHRKALERTTYSSKSFLIGLALALEQITVEEAALATMVEVSSQIQRWGEVEDCKLISYCPAVAYVCLQPTTWITKTFAGSLQARPVYSRARHPSHRS